MGFLVGHVSLHCQGVLPPWKWGGTCYTLLIGEHCLSTTHLGLAALFYEAFLPQMPVHLQKGLGWGLGFELCV